MLLQLAMPHLYVVKQVGHVAFQVKTQSASRQWLFDTQLFSGLVAHRLGLVEKPPVSGVTLSGPALSLTKGGRERRTAICPLPTDVKTAGVLTRQDRHCSFRGRQTSLFVPCHG
jgi:hypothetical protein